MAQLRVCVCVCAGGCMHERQRGNVGSDFISILSISDEAFCRLAFRFALVGQVFGKPRKI